MPFVVVATFIHLMIPVLDVKEDIYFIKRKGAKGYFYYNGDKSFDELSAYVKKTISTELSYLYVLECYGIYNGMMDFVSYLPLDKKDAHPYYSNPNKELSEEELASFLQAKGIA